MRYLLMLCLCLGLGGCATLRSLAESIERDPAAALSYAVNGIHTALTAAGVGFDVWAAAHPGEAAASRLTFDGIIANVTTAVRLGSDVGQILTARDAATRLAPARDAMLTLFNFLSSLAGGGTGHAASPEMQEALAATAAAAQG